MTVLYVVFYLPCDEGYRLLCSLKDGTAVLASDGSYQEVLNKGTHAYILVSMDSDDGQIKGAATSPHSDHMSSAPTEHYGALAVLITLIVLLYHHNEDGHGWPPVKLYIDNEEIVNRGNILNPKFCNVQQYLVHDYDLWKVTSELQKSIHLSINFEWVRGHQSADENNNNNIAILLNIDVDRMATAQYEKNVPPPHRGAFHAGEVCFHQMGFHVQKIKNAITARESDTCLLEYYKQSGWTTTSLELVDWYHLEQFLKQCHPIERCNIIQLMHNWQNTGYQQRQISSEQQSNEVLLC
jgi:ribonuclease HI